MEMPKVTKCEVADCAYNLKNLCHAGSITIGDSIHPRCDTFCQFSRKGGDPAATAEVGACKVSTCKYNKNLECSASQIWVGYKGLEPDCMTFGAK